MSGPVFSEDTLDRYARMVQRSLAVPVALVSLVEQERQVFIGAIGLPAPYSETRETPLSHSFCQYVVKDEAPLVITDARLDARLFDNLAITDLGVIAYAGWPITDHTGRTVGSLCAIDSEPRVWQRDELDALADIAAACSTELSERGQREATTEALLMAEELSERSRVLLSMSERLNVARTVQEVAAAVDDASRTELGCTHAGIWLRRTSDLDVLARQPAAHETLVRPPGTTGGWPAADTFPVFAVDSGNPLGRAVLEGRPVFLADQQELRELYPDATNPLQGEGARACLVLSAAGVVYGALGLVWPQRREFTHDDRLTLAALAAYAAQSLGGALLLEERAQVAITLQRAMLTSLPDVPGLRLAARYRPAAARDQVGGDWYDAVAMPSGSVSLVIGDVTGHDTRAAAVMGQLRNMLRTLDWAEDATPARVVERLDLAMRDLGVHTVATLAFLRLGATPAVGGARTVSWTSAGHPTPVVVAPGGDARLVAGPEANDLLLGVNPDARRRDHELALGPGSVLLLYTDGLVERRGETVTAGTSRLVEVVSTLALDDLDDFLDGVLEAMVGDQHDDDVALLALTVDPPGADAV